MMIDKDAMSILKRAIARFFIHATAQSLKFMVDLSQQS